MIVFAGGLNSNVFFLSFFGRSLISTQAATYNKSYSISGCKRIDKAVAYHAVEFGRDEPGAKSRR